MADHLAIPKGKQAITLERKHSSEIEKPSEFGRDETGKYNFLHTRRKLALE